MKELFFNLVLTISSAFVTKKVMDYYIEKNHVDPSKLSRETYIIDTKDKMTYETMMICKKITCTECKTAQDIIPFLRKYKEMTLKENIDLSDIELKQKKTIESYNNINVLYYKEVKLMKKKEILSFLTFHWALNTFGQKYLPLYYKKIQDASNIYNDGNWEYIEKYRKIIEAADI